MPSELKFFVHPHIFFHKFDMKDHQSKNEYFEFLSFVFSCMKMTKNTWT